MSELALLEVACYGGVLVVLVALCFRRRESLWELRRIKEPERSTAIVLPLLVGLSVFLLVWLILSFGNPSGPARVPSPHIAILHLFGMLGSGEIWKEIGLSFQRIVIGFTLAAIAGSLIGWIAGTYFFFGGFFLPLSSFLRYIPPMALVSLMVLYFGIGEHYKVAVVFVGVFFFIIQMTIDSVDSLDVPLLEMGVVAGLTKRRILFDVVIPGTLPQVVDTWRVNLSGAWTFLVVAEIVGATGGLGHFITVARRFGRIEELYAAILLFGIIGFLSDWSISQMKRILFRWKR